MTPVRVVLADDHPLFRAGLRAVIDAAEDLEVVGEAGTGIEAVTLGRAADLVLMDLRMAVVDGLEATRRLKVQSPSTAVLVLSMSEEEAALNAAVRAGARGYLLKGARPAEVLAAVRAVAAGQVVFAARFATQVLGAVGAPTALTGPLASLTDRERAVLDLVARGLDNAAVASRLHLSAGTTRNYVAACSAKLATTSRAQLVVLAREAGLGV